MTKAQVAEYKMLCTARDNGRLLTPDGLLFICRACNYDPTTIGQYFLEALPKVCPNK